MFGIHSMVLKTDRTVWATGWNKYGQLGDGTTTDKNTFVNVSNTFVNVSNTLVEVSEGR